MTFAPRSRQWMHALARLRGRVVRLRQDGSGTDQPGLDLAEEALNLTETLRAECAELHGRCQELERQLGTVHDEMNTLLGHAPFGTLITDGNGTIVEANRAASAIFGRSAPRLRDEMLLHFFDDRLAFADLLRQMREAAEPVTVMLRLRPRERAPFDAVLTVLRDPRAANGRWVWFVAPASEPRTPVGTSGRRAAAAAVVRVG